MMAEVVKLTPRQNGLWKVVVLCPFCKETHSHGASEEDEELHRGADCAKGAYHVPLGHFRRLYSFSASRSASSARPLRYSTSFSK